MKDTREKALPWYAGGVRFTCLGCGRCCRGEPGAIWVTPGEGKKIAEYLSLNAVAWRGSLTRRWVFPSIRERENGTCLFYDEPTSRCTIYSVRPTQCSLFPFWPSLMKSRENWDDHAISCPGMNSGRLYAREEIDGILAVAPFPFL